MAPISAQPQGAPTSLHRTRAAARLDGTPRAEAATALSPPASQAVPSASTSPAPRQTGDLFDDQTPLALALEAPLKTIFRDAHAGQPDPIIPGLWQRAKEPVKGTVSTSQEGATLPVSVRVRGNLSLAECEFPKLAVRFDDHAPGFASSVFAPVERLKVGTHCADPSGPGDQVTTQGRLLGEKSTHREALVWNLYRALEPEFSLHARPARITYTDTTEAPATVKQRDAFVFEHPNSAAARLGLAPYPRLVDGETKKTPVLEESELNALSTREFSPQRALRIVMFQAMVGNWDFAVDRNTAKSTGGHVWNTDVLVQSRPDGTRELVPVPVDFDRASMISGKIQRGRASPGTRSRSPEVQQATASLRQYLRPYKKADVHAAKQFFIEHKDAMLAAIDRATVDDAGRELAHAHVRAFFVALELVSPD